MTPLEAALLDALETEGAAVLVRAADRAVLYANRAARILGWDESGAICAGGTTTPLADGGTLTLRRKDVSSPTFFEARESMHHTITHDLMTPIGVVDGFSELLTMSVPDDPELQMFAARVRAGTGRLTLLARLISPYAWLAADLPIDQARMMLGPLLDTVVLAVAGRARDRAVTLEMRDDDSLPPVVGDAALLGLALEQVVVNGLLYSEPGQSVTVAVGQEGEAVVLTVQDHGVGIPEHEIAHVFDRNTRGTNPRVQAVNGAGYGLTVTRLAIERMGGQITVQSTPGVGTTVTIRLRAAD
jgi:signal transduction histidine kinase